MPPHGRWLPNGKIRALVALGWRNTEIARANEDATGYKPSPSAVTRKLQKLGIPPRNTSHKDLIWWRVRPQHSHDPIYYGLQALDKERKGATLTSQERYRARVLSDMLTARGGPFVVDYRPDQYPERGFILVPAIEKDTDIVRRGIAQEGEQQRQPQDNLGGRSYANRPVRAREILVLPGVRVHLRRAVLHEARREEGPVRAERRRGGAPVQQLGVPAHGRTRRYTAGTAPAAATATAGHAVNNRNSLNRDSPGTRLSRPVPGLFYVRNQGYRYRQAAS